VDAALVSATRAGDLRAWEQLIRRHQEIVFRSAYLATRDAVTAEDVTKAAFLRAHHSIGSLKEETATPPWLVGITVTVARSHLRELAQRRDAKMPMRESSPRLAASPPRLEPGVSRPTSVEHEMLAAAFDGLADEDRLILAARYSFGFSGNDAATRLGMEPDQVDDRLRTSVGRLRARIVQAPGAPGSRTGELGATGGPARRVDRLMALSDDQLGSMTMAVAFSGLPWTPDVAAAVCLRLAREAAAYPEQVATQALASSVASSGPVSTASATRPEGRTSLGDVSVRPRRRGRPGALRATVLVMGFAVLGFALAAAAQGWELPDDMRGRVDALLGRSSSESGAPGGPDTVVATSVTQQPQVAVPLGQQATVHLEESAPLGGLAASPGQVPAVSIVGTRMLDDGDVGAKVRVDWRPGDSFGSVVSSRLERGSGGGTWTEVTAADAPDPLLTTLGADRSYRLRVRAIDGTGAEVVSPPIGARLSVRDPRSKRIALETGEWITRRGNIIKLRLIATAPDSSFNTEFSGSSVALVGPAGPDRGVIGIRVDEGDWTTGDLRTWQDSPQMVLYSQHLPHGRHSLDVRAEAEGVAVDAVLIVRTAGT
jgi:RNA polymerase sigma-70 factor (ECF subfamily)